MRSTIPRHGKASYITGYDLNIYLVSNLILNTAFDKLYCPPQAYISKLDFRDHPAVSRMSAIDTSCILTMHWWRCSSWWMSFKNFGVDAPHAEKLLYLSVNRCRSDWLCGFWYEIRSREGSSEVAVLKSFVFSSYRIRVFTGQRNLLWKPAKKVSLGPDFFFFCES